jgi:glycosyltransferase involved in cell wall biosynthesis
MLTMIDSLYYGPHPWEMDGGAVVNYYLLKKQNELRPRDVYWGIPKVPEQVQPQVLPFVNYPPFTGRESVIDIMDKYQIPLINLFHIGRPDMEALLNPLKEIGAKSVLHQTIHWRDDDILKMGDKLNEFDKIVCPTNFANEVFRTSVNIPEEKLITIPHAVDTDRFYKRPTVLEKHINKQPHQKVILYSGRLNLWKGVQTIIPLVRGITRDYDAIFILRGSFFNDPEGRAMHEIFTRMSRNNPNFHLITEWKSPEFMEELFAMTDIVLFNTGHEGFGVPLIEAQAVGAIPITTAIDNHREILGPSGACGLLLAPSMQVGTVNEGTPIKIATSDALEGAIRWVLDNPDEAQLMGQRGLANVHQRFKLSDIAQRWLDLYYEMLEGHDMKKASEEWMLKI